jgi:hypothetical protein
MSPFLITSSLYGSAGFLAVDAAAPRLSSLEATFEYGTVAAFPFDLVDHAAVASRFDHDGFVRFLGVFGFVAGPTLRKASQDKIISRP